MILLDNGKIFWWGTNSTLNYLNQPILLDFFFYFEVIFFHFVNF